MMWSRKLSSSVPHLGLSFEQLTSHGLGFRAQGLGFKNILGGGGAPGPY